MAGTSSRAAGALLVAVGLVVAACGTHATGNPPSSRHTPTSATPAGTTPTSSVAATTTVPPTTTVVTPSTIPGPVTTSSTTTTTTVAEPVTLGPGDRGPAVKRLQEAMAAAGFFRDVVDGVFGERTAAAVVAVHKALDAPRTALWSPQDWETLEAFPGPSVPDRPEEPDRVEIDLTRQLLYRLEGGAVVDIVPVSSGNGELYENAAGNLVRARTPRGGFSFYKRYDGWRISYLGGLYRPWYFSGGYAIHGSASVPAVPASHGCVRVPTWEADYLWSEFWIGLPVHVWD